MSHHIIDACFSARRLASARIYGAQLELTQAAPCCMLLLFFLCALTQRPYSFVYCYSLLNNTVNFWTCVGTCLAEAQTYVFADDPAFHPRLQGIRRP